VAHQALEIDLTQTLIVLPAATAFFLMFNRAVPGVDGRAARCGFRMTLPMSRDFDITQLG
jgi:hypothetical protein